MRKDDRIQLRVSKGTKLVLNEYCSMRNINITDLIFGALEEYFIKNGKMEIYSLIRLADKYIYREKISIDNVESELVNNELFDKVILVNKDKK